MFCANFFVKNLLYLCAAQRFAEGVLPEQGKLLTQAFNVMGLQPGTCRGTRWWR